jgi:nucleoside-diphosphate-sugar epimerase
MVNDHESFHIVHAVNGDGETSRVFWYIDNAVQANLLAAVTEYPEALNQVCNVAVNERMTLNQLFELFRSLLEPHFPLMKDIAPIYLDVLEIEGIDVSSLNVSEIHAEGHVLMLNEELSVPVAFDQESQKFTLDYQDLGIVYP